MKVKFLLPALLVTVAVAPAQTPPPAPVPDWSAPAATQPTNVPPPNVDAAAIAARMAQAQSNRAARTVALPGAPGAAIPPASGVPAGSVANPDSMAMTVRPPATASTIPDPDTIFTAGSINWTAAPLSSVLEVYSEYVGRNLLYPATLSMKTEIALRQSTPLTRLEIVQMIEAVLSLNQISVINVGEKFVTVMTAAEAAKIPGEINTLEASELPRLGNVITHIVQLKYTKPSEMVNVLMPFVSGSSASPILPVDGSSMLVLRDNVANVKRMLEMIEKVDIVVQSEILSEVIPIKYAKAEEIANALSSVGGSTAGTVGTSRPTATRTTGAGATARPGMTQPGAYNQPGATGLGATPTPSSAATFGDRVRNLITRAAGAGDFNILGETKIIADVRSNSLLVFATKQDMEMIKDIISKLDVVLAQVLIETIIMDVSLGNDLTLGVTAGQRPKKHGDVTSGGFFNNSGQLGTLENFLNNIASTNGIFPTGSGLNYFGKFNDDLFVAVTALAQDSRVNVIQKPRIQTSHATQASLFVGETVPYISSTYYGGGFGGGPSSSYQQLRVGINLTVTPFINQDGLVVMTIEETIDEISGNVIIDNNPVPATTSRTLSAEVAVRDRETIILGGFIRNSDNKSKSGVPILKDIPLLGALFRSSSSSKARKELIVLMRPTVLRTPEVAALQVDVEKQRLPGVRAAERALDKVELEQAEAERARKPAPTPADFSKPAPFTPEDEQFFQQPTP